MKHIFILGAFWLFKDLCSRTMILLLVDVIIELIRQISVYIYVCYTSIVNPGFHRYSIEKIGYSKERNEHSRTATKQVLSMITQYINVSNLIRLSLNGIPEIIPHNVYLFSYRNDLNISQNKLRNCTLMQVPLTLQYTYSILTINSSSNNSQITQITHCVSRLLIPQF